MNSTTGLDIGSHSIKLVELGHDKTGWTLLSAGSALTPPKALTSTLQADFDAIAVVIKKLVRESGAKMTNIGIALPESQVFTRVIEVPQLSKRELASAIKWEAEQYIPLPLEQVNMDYAILRDTSKTGTNNMELLLVAAPKVLLEKYLTILESADIAPSAVETEVIASSRVLARSLKNVKTVMMISIGAQTTDLAILRSGIIAFTRSISAGGEALSRALSQGLGFESAQAEEYKRTYGLDRDKLQGKIVGAVKPIMDTIIGEMKRAVAFYQEKNKEEKIGTVVLSGGTARLPGMVVYVASELGVEVQLANPWFDINRDARFKVLDSEGPVFSVATGLALRS